MATIHYYDYFNGDYIENIAGELLGLTWLDANGNTTRLVLFLMDFSSLMHGIDISFLYRAHIQIVGTTEWLLRDTRTFKVSNSVQIPVNTITELSSLARLFSPIQLAPPGQQETIGQLELFVELYLKGNKFPGLKLIPMYEWLADVMAELEGQELAIIVEE